MSDTKFTPGPWSVRKSVKTGHFWISGNGWTKHTRTYGFAGSNGDATVEARCNAILIAAAPELYAALETLLEAIPQDLLISNEDEANAAWGNARAVLAKARGGA